MKSSFEHWGPSVPKFEVDPDSHADPPKLEDSCCIVEQPLALHRLATIISGSELVPVRLISRSPYRICFCPTLSACSHY